MAEENKKQEEKMKETKTEEKKEEENKAEGSMEKTEKKMKEKKQEKIKKQCAVVNAQNLAISKKDSMAICKFIKGKDIERASNELGKVLSKKIAIPMKGEYPHRRGIERGSYPESACNVFIKLLRSLSANAAVNGIENPYITIAKANRAPRPYKRAGSMRFKRTHVFLEAREKVIKANKKENEEKN